MLHLESGAGGLSFWLNMDGPVHGPPRDLYRYVPVYLLFLEYKAHRRLILLWTTDLFVLTGLLSCCASRVSEDGTTACHIPLLG